MREGSEVLLKFVGRAARRDEMEFVKIETAVSGARDGEMAIVYGIERTAKKRDTARMMFCGGAVRLRGGQCFSQKSFQSSVSSTPEQTTLLKVFQLIFS
jgi:hypothetical protein